MWKKGMKSDWSVCVHLDPKDVTTASERTLERAVVVWELTERCLPMPDMVSATAAASVLFCSFSLHHHFPSSALSLSSSQSPTLLFFPSNSTRKSVS